MDSFGGAWTSDPAGGIRYFQTHHEHAEWFARDEGGGTRRREGDSRRVSPDRIVRRSPGGRGKPISAEPDPKCRSSLRGTDLRWHAANRWSESISKRRRRHARD